MPFNSQFDLQTAILTLAEQPGTRVIVVKRRGLDQTERLDNNPNLKVISEAPYEKLFPLAKTIVHHGGAGTTAACLQAGKPLMVCPILYPVGDQQFWGQIAFQKGIAVKPVPLSRMTAQKFMESVQTLQTNQAPYKQAARLKEIIDPENGLETAIQEIEKELT